MDIINTAIYQSQYPTAFKLDVTSPVPKSDDPLEPKSWRLVIILPATSKVLEKVPTEAALLSPEQYAGKSTV